MSTSPRVILTGGSRGLGLAILRLLLTKHNARVAAISRSFPPELRAVQDEYSDRVHIVQGDAGKIEDNEGIVRTTVEKWGGIDGIIVNAGTMSLQNISDLNLQDITPYVNSNLSSILYLVTPSLPHLRKTNGKIVLVSSGASTGAYAAWSLYCMAKAGMNSLARCIAVEEKEHGIGVWAIRPGLIDTPMQAQIREFGPAKMSSTDMKKFTTAHEEGKLLAPELPGGVIAALAVTEEPPLELNGQYIDWADEKLARFRSS